METLFTQQEILVNTGTRFLAREWSAKNENENSDNRSHKEKLEEACWNGLLKEMVPELFNGNQNRRELPLWKIRAMESFLELEFSDYPAPIDKHFSINPYLFLLAEEPN